MKSASIVAIVVMAHVVIAGSFVMIQGCGTSRGGYSSSTPAPIAKMPGGSTAPLETAPRMVWEKPKPVPSTPAETTPYTVKQGDSLSVIAQRFGVSAAAIVGLNKLTNPDNISVGQSLLLPGKVDVESRASIPKKQAKKPALGEHVYIVKRGDSLSVIAAREGVSVSVLREANGLANDRILVDQELIIPGASGARVVDESDADSEGPMVEEDSPLAAELAADPGGSALLQADDARPEPLLRSYVVQEGEDLYSVSLLWDVTADELKRVNELDGTELSPGQELKIPMTQ